MDDAYQISQTVRDIPFRRHVKWLVLIPVVILAFILLSGFQSVNAYESCLLVKNGTIRDEWGPGLHWHFPIGSDTTCYRTARTTLEASPGEAGAGADFNDDAVSARSKDGQIIDAVSYRIAFNTPVEMVNSEGDVVNPENHEFIYTTVGAQTQQAIVDSVVSFYARPEVRAVMQLHTSDELLTGDLSDISLEIEERLRPKFEMNGVVLESFVLSKPDFNDAFEQKLQEREQAELDAEIVEQQSLTKVNEANTNAQISEIEDQAAAKRTNTQTQVEAESIVTIANAEATAVALQIDAIGGLEAYLQAQQIAAMSEWPVQIIGDSATMPMIQVTQPTPVPEE